MVLLKLIWPHTAIAPPKVEYLQVSLKPKSYNLKTPTFFEFDSSIQTPYFFCWLQFHSQIFMLLVSLSVLRDGEWVDTLPDMRTWPLFD